MNRFDCSPVVTEKPRFRPSAQIASFRTANVASSFLLWGWREKENLGVEREREIERSERQVERKSLYLLLGRPSSPSSPPPPFTRVHTPATLSIPIPLWPSPHSPSRSPFSRFPHAPHESRPRPPPLPPRSPSTPGAAPFLHARRRVLASPSVPTRRRHAAPTASVPARRPAPRPRPTASVPARRSGRARGLRPQVRRPAAPAASFGQVRVLVVGDSGPRRASLPAAPLILFVSTVRQNPSPEIRRQIRSSSSLRFHRSPEPLPRNTATDTFILLFSSFPPFARTCDRDCSFHRRPIRSPKAILRFHRRPIRSPKSTLRIHRSPDPVPPSTAAGAVFDHTSQGEMELPVADPGPVRAEGLLLQCPYCDLEAMHKLAQILLPGLAAVCVDSTTGDLFRKPSVVAVDLRKEMVDHITQRSETFIADALIEAEANQDPESDMLEDPYEIVSIFMDDFSSTKRNIIGHVSGWLLSDSREDKIDDFVQEMEMTRFWPLERREAIAEVLLKNVDLKTKFHCPEKSENKERLADHKSQCSFRPVTCPNEGCRAKVSVRCMHDHDSACLFKILPCEQNCEKRLMRRDMDRHCVTVCPMRPMKCPFGCDSSFPEHNLEEHCSEFLQPHLLKVLQVIHKKGFTVDELKDRALLLEKCDDHGKLAKAQDARSLTNVVKDLEAKMKDDESS